jgi:hypothetical protein
LSFRVRQIRGGSAAAVQALLANGAEVNAKDNNGVLIATVRSPQTSPKAKDVRMRFDLNGDLTDNDIREYETALKPRTIVKTEGGEEYLLP